MWIKTTKQKLKVKKIAKKFNNLAKEMMTRTSNTINYET